MRIATHALSWCGYLERASLPDSLREISFAAFSFCSALNRVDMPSSLEVINEDAFRYCPLDEGFYGPVGDNPASVYASANDIGYNLYNLSLYVDGFPWYVDGCQAGTQLPSVNDPEDAERVFLGWRRDGDEAFWDMTNYVMPQADLELHAVMEYPFTREAEGEGLRLLSYTGSADRVRVPEVIDGLPVLSIAPDAFAGTGEMMSLYALTGSLTLIGNAGSVTEAFALAQGIAFEPLLYTVSFVTYGGSSVPERQAAKGSLLGDLPTSVRDEHSLLGWYRDAILTEPWDFAADMMPAEPLTLYAGWERIDPAILDSGFTYREENGEAIVTGYRGYLMRPVLPTIINGLPVTGIDEFAFYGNKTLDALVIPEGVRSIGRYAFAVSAISSLSIPASVTAIGEYAMMNCAALGELSLSGGVPELPRGMLQGCTGLLSLTIPEGVTGLGENFLSDCMFLLELSLPESLLSVGKRAFANCSSLTTIQIPSGVWMLGPDAFNGCSALQTIEADAASPHFLSVDGVLYDKSGGILLRYPSGKTAASFTVPASVWMIGEAAFRDSRLESVMLPAGLLDLGVDAFFDSRKLTNIVWPDGISLYSIPDGAFRYCTALTSITIPESVQSVGQDAFSGCLKLNELYFGTQVALIDETALPDNGWLTLYGTSGTYVQEFAQSYSLRFVDPQTMVPVQGIVLDRTEITMNEWETTTLSATLSPADTSETEVAWYSSDESVALVDETGLVSARMKGEALIFAFAANGAVAQCLVRVERPVVIATGLRFTLDQYTVMQYYARQLVALFTPYSVTDRRLSWASSDPSVADVNATGLLAAYTPGETTITVTAQDGSGVTASCTVYVKRDITSLVFGDIALQTYTGSAIEPALTVSDGGITLTSGVDYTLTYADNTNAGTATVTVTGVGFYSGVKELTFAIERASYDMSGAGWDYAAPFDYDGEEKSVQVTGLAEGVTVISYSGNTATLPGTYIASVVLAYDSLNYEEPVIEDLVWEITDPKLPGDANGDDSVDIMDLVAIIDHIVYGAPVVSELNADANEDGAIDIMDLVWIIDFIVGN